MTGLARLALAVLALLAVAPAAALAADPLKTVVQATDGFIRPAYRQLAGEAAAMRAGMAALCATPSPAALAAARQRFSSLVDRWSAVEIIRFGPITEDNRLDRMLFWPDRKGLGLRQVQAVLAQRDAEALDPARLAGKSVALQGLGALEFVLYGTGADALAGSGDPYRCRFGEAVAGNVAAIGLAVSAAWEKRDGFAQQWANPGPGNPLYRDARESVTELLQAVIDGLELVRDVRVNGFLGASTDKDRPRLAIFWRSGKTADALAANLAGLRELFDASGLGAALPEGEAWLAQSADAQFANGIAAARTVALPVEQALADPASRDKLALFRLVTSSLSELFGTRVSGALGLTAGFSSLDGD